MNRKHIRLNEKAITNCKSTYYEYPERYIKNVYKLLPKIGKLKKTFVNSIINNLNYSNFL